jgi:hypothetical protein
VIRLFELLERTHLMPTHRPQKVRQFVWWEIADMSAAHIGLIRANSLAPSLTNRIPPENFRCVRFASSAGGGLNMGVPPAARAVW